MKTKQITYVRHYNPLLNTKAIISRKKAPWKNVFDFKKWVKSIQTACYNGTHMVHTLGFESILTIDLVISNWMCNKCDAPKMLVRPHQKNSSWNWNANQNSILKFINNRHYCTLSPHNPVSTNGNFSRLFIVDFGYLTVMYWEIHVLQNKLLRYLGQLVLRVRSEGT